MKGLIAFLCITGILICNTGNLQAQFSQQGVNVQVGGLILDSANDRPISFANVGFMGKGVGTVSNRYGRFNLEYKVSSISPEDILQISVIGYTTQRFTINQLKQLLNSEKPIRLMAETFSLDEVIVDSKSYRSTTIGNSKLDDDRFGYWKNEKGLGGEIATRIKISHEGSRIDALHLKVLENLSDSLLVRINVYDTDPVFFTPRTNLVRKAIYHTINTKKGKETIPLKQYGIRVHDDVIVSIELIEVYGSRIGLALAASSNKRSSFIKRSSQDAWDIQKGKAMAFTLDVTYPETNKNAITKRVIPDLVNVYWDASAKLQQRNIDAELELLERYFKALKNTTVQVHKFALGYEEEQSFKVKRGAANEVINYLNATLYEGESDFSRLKTSTSEKQHVNLVFTDGQGIFSSLQPVFNSTTFAISSSDWINKDALETLSVFADGAHINLKEQSPKGGLEVLLKDIPESEFGSQTNNDQQLLKGTLSSEMGALAGGRITNLNTGISVLSKALGEYELQASDDHILEITYPGMKSKRLKIPNGKELNIYLETEGDWLEEVILEGKKKAEMVETATGTKNIDGVGTKLDRITYKDIKPHMTRLEDVLSQEPQLLIERNPYTGDVVYSFPRTRYMSINNPLLPIIVLDGMIYQQSLASISGSSPANTVPPIDVQNISSIVVTSSLAAVTQYGNIAAGGAIIIVTKTNDKNYRNALITKVDNLLVQGNDYKEEVAALMEAYKKPAYSIQLEGAHTYKDALSIYEQYRSADPGRTNVFLLEASRSFRKWNRDKANRILTTISAQAPRDILGLRMLAYELDYQSNTKKLVQLYEYIASIAPQEIQSYRDLALAYQTNHQYTEAFDMYKQMLNNEIADLDFKPLQKTIENELLHLLAFHKSKLSFQDLPNSLLDASFKKDRRLVFEWTNPEASFEIQFVNPQGKFFKWTHSKLDNLSRIQDEFAKGYLMEEFALDDAPPGVWLVNVEYFNEDEDSTPVYLKYTAFENYATPQETKTIKIIDLRNQQSKVTLGKITLN